MCETSTSEEKRIIVDYLVNAGYDFDPAEIIDCGDYLDLTRVSLPNLGKLKVPYLHQDGTYTRLQNANQQLVERFANGELVRVWSVSYTSDYSSAYSNTWGGTQPPRKLSFKYVSHKCLCCGRKDNLLAQVAEMMGDYCTPCTNARRLEKERKTFWIVMVGNREVYTIGKGLTLDEAHEKAGKYLRSAYHRGGSSDYHKYHLIESGVCNVQS